LWILFPILTGADSNADRDAAIERMIQLQDKRQYETKPTHGDFNSLNVLVKDDNIVGIIDWEMAGWYPDYWESTSAWHVNHVDDYWRPEVEKVLDADYHAEAERSGDATFKVLETYGKLPLVSLCSIWHLLPLRVRCAINSNRGQSITITRSTLSG